MLLRLIRVDLQEMKLYREAGPSTVQPSTASNIQQTTMKIEGAPVQDMNNQPQTVQVQYVDQDGNVLHVVNQPGDLFKDIFAKRDKLVIHFLINICIYKISKI